MRHWTNGGALTGFLGDQMEVEVRSALAENERLRADLAAEHALADQLADGLRDEARYHALRGNAARALDAHEEARRER
jgi:hypothetical protein